jgi:hypothetical protein
VPAMGMVAPSARGWAGLSCQLDTDHRQVGPQRPGASKATVMRRAARVTPAPAPALTRRECCSRCTISPRHAASGS